MSRRGLAAALFGVVAGPVILTTDLQHAEGQRGSRRAGGAPVDTALVAGLRYRF